MEKTITCKKLQEERVCVETSYYPLEIPGTEDLMEKTITP